MATIGSWVGRVWGGRSLERLKARLAPHRVPLALVGLCAVVGQVAVRILHPQVGTFPDSASYVLPAQKIAGSFTFVQTFRTPGYPSFLAAVFALTGGVDYNQAATCADVVPSAYCQQALRPVLLAQAALAMLVTLGLYVLIYRLTRRRVIAGVVAALLALNLYVVSWERAVLSEFLSYASIVAVFLCYERFVRVPRTRTAVGLGLALFAAIMVRPFNIYLPLLLLGLFALRLLWLKRWRAQWRPLVVAGAVVFSTLLGYLLINTATNDFFGLTWEQNVTLLGKVMEYKMEGMATDPQYQPIQADLETYLATGGKREPWLFGARYPAYAANNYQAAGAFARSLILRHPLTYAKRTLPVVIQTWLVAPTFYAPTNTGAIGAATIRVGPTWVIPGLLDISKAEEDAYLLLPGLLALIGYSLWRRPRDITAFLLIAILGAVVGGIALASAGNYSEYYRIRSPIDWGMIAVSLIVVLTALEKAARWDRSSRETHPALTGWIPRDPCGVAENARASIV